jgi:hypothetical protein
VTDSLEVESADGNENEHYSLFLGFDKASFRAWSGVSFGLGGNRDEGAGTLPCTGVGRPSHWTRARCEKCWAASQGQSKVYRVHQLDVHRISIGLPDNFNDMSGSSDDHSSQLNLESSPAQPSPASVEPNKARNSVRYFVYANKRDAAE